jgi:hypothetical protein
MKKLKTRGFNLLKEEIKLKESWKEQN